MTPDEFVTEVLAAEAAELDRRLRALDDGDVLCVHEDTTWPGEYWRTRSVHVLRAGRPCKAAGRRTRYGPMTAEIRAQIDVPPTP